MNTTTAPPLTTPAFGKPEVYRYGLAGALVAASALLGMFIIAALTGVDQQPFELIRPLGVFQADLLAASDPLRLVLTFDMIFAAAYTVTFMMLALALWEGSRRLLVGLALAALLSTTVLDLMENHDILAMLVTVEAGYDLTLDQLQDRAVWSQLKFHLSYIGLVLFGLALPSRTLVEKALRWSLIAVQLPVGVLIYTFPAEALTITRYAFFLGGMTMLAWLFRDWSQSDAR